MFSNCLDVSLSVWWFHTFILDVAQRLMWFDFVFVEKLRDIPLVMSVFNPVWCVSQSTFLKRLDCFSICLRGTKKGWMRTQKEKEWVWCNLSCCQDCYDSNGKHFSVTCEERKLVIFFFCSLEKRVWPQTEMETTDKVAQSHKPLLSVWSQL